MRYIMALEINILIYKNNKVYLMNALELDKSMVYRDSIDFLSELFECDSSLIIEFLTFFNKSYRFYNFEKELFIRGGSVSIRKFKRLIVSEMIEFVKSSIDMFNSNFILNDKKNKLMLYRKDIHKLLQGYRNFNYTISTLFSCICTVNQDYIGIKLPINNNSSWTHIVYESFVKGLRQDGGILDSLYALAIEINRDSPHLIVSKLTITGMRRVSKEVSYKLFMVPDLFYFLKPIYRSNKLVYTIPDEWLNNPYLKKINFIENYIKNNKDLLIASTVLNFMYSYILRDYSVTLPFKCDSALKLIYDNGMIVIERRK